MAREYSLVKVRLVPWSEDDLPLLVRLNAPEMMQHLGGPETAEQVSLRHERYVGGARAGGGLFKVVLEPEGEAVGNVNFWDREWKGEQVYEMGWSVVPEFQGRGIGFAMVAQAVEIARATKRRAAVHAFPSVDNPPSNAICRKAGFVLLGEVRFEYPQGHWMQCNDWRVSLA